MWTGILQSSANFQSNSYRHLMAAVNENLYNFNAGILPKNACIVIVHTEWNSEIVDKLLEGCIGKLKQFGMSNYKVISVPGAFEIPFAIKNFWESIRISLKNRRHLLHWVACYAVTHLILITYAKLLRMECAP